MQIFFRQFRPRITTFEHKLKEPQQKFLKLFISKIIFICGSALSEYEGPSSREEERIRESVFVRESLAFLSNVELPYYSVEFFKPVRIYCGREGTVRQLNATVLVYPKCNNCSTRPDIPKRKRKVVDQHDLSGGKKHIVEPGRINNIVEHGRINLYWVT